MLRKGKPADAEAILDLHVASIRRLCSGHYSATQIEEWVGIKAANFYRDGMAEGAEYVLSEDGAAVAGFGILSPAESEILAVYVHPDAAGGGVGRAILRELEAIARQRDIASLQLKSTINAVGFYQNAGYTMEGPENHALPSGQLLSCFAMRKQL